MSESSDRLLRPSAFVPADRRGQSVAAAAVASTGVIVSAAHIGYLNDGGTVATLLGPGVGLLFGAVLVGSAAVLVRGDLAAYLPSVAGWTVGGALVVGAVGQLFRLSRAAAGEAVAAAGLLIWFLVAAGGVVGLCVGVYDATLRRARRELASEQERAEEMLERLSANNRALRHGVRDSVAEVRERSTVAPVATGGEAAVGTDERAAASAEESVDGTGTDDEPTDLVSVVQRTVDHVHEDHPETAVEVDLPETAPTTATPSVDIAVRTLVENAVEHGQQPRVSCERDEDVVRLHVVDDGPGVPDDVLAALEDPNDDTVSGGDGLWMANWAVEQSDGTLSFDTDSGTTATVELPAATE